MLVKSWAGELKRDKRAHRAPFWLASGSFVIFQLTADYYCHKRGHPKYYIWNLRAWIWNANAKGQSHWGNPLPTFVQYVKIFKLSSMFVFSAVCLSIGLSVCPSVCLLVCPSVRLSLLLSRNAVACARFLAFFSDVIQSRLASSCFALHFP